MITNSQKKQILRLCNYDMQNKTDVVNRATNGRTESLRAISFSEANSIIELLGGHKEFTNNWGKFDAKKKSHLNILSLLRSMGWTTNVGKYNSVADIERFGAWLDSDKSPVRKPLLKMTPKEVSKIIVALQSMETSILKQKYGRK